MLTKDVDMLKKIGNMLLHKANMSLSEGWNSDPIYKPLWATIVWRFRDYIPNTYFK